MRFTWSKATWATVLVALAIAAALAAGRRVEVRPSIAASIEPSAPLPADLAATGLYADWATKTIAATNRPFSPQYPLWTDGAKKQRWIYLPPGAPIDASSSDAWQFPIGTRLWKEFSFASQPVETRYMERTAAGWRYATYVWSEDGKTATLAPPRGTKTSAEVAPGKRHDVPSEGDCRVCHGNDTSSVLGFSALQLSGDRDPNALHTEPLAPGSLDLPALVRTGALRNYRGSTSPRIAARTPTERAALGYLHGNCGGCHRDGGALASLGMVLASSSEQHDEPTRKAVFTTTLDRASHLTPTRMRIASGAPDRSVVIERMGSRVPSTQMPPLGTQLVDVEAVRLLSAWIEQLGH